MCSRSPDHDCRQLVLQFVFRKAENRSDKLYCTDHTQTKSLESNLTSVQRLVHFVQQNWLYSSSICCTRTAVHSATLCEQKNIKHITQRAMVTVFELVNEV